MADIAPPPVSFTVNVCNADVPFLDKTLRHMLRALNFPFHERLLAYDPGRQEGKYAERRQGDRVQMEGILDRLLGDGIIDRIDIVPWDEEEQQRILKRYFGHASIDLKDFSGAPIYQYLWALDRCSGDVVFHADSDMLFYSASPRSWIYDALELFERENTVIMATPHGGPPQARNWVERFLNRSFERTPRSLWHTADSVSTRYFLMQRGRFEQALPLLQHKSGEPLENSLTHTFRERGLERWSMNGYTHWAIHPWKHDDNFIRHLDDLVWAVEHGVYPFRRTGYRWDMRTEGPYMREWLAVLRAHGRGLS